MTRLYVLVEGQTEEEFIKAQLGPNLRPRGLWVQPIVVETSRDAFGRKRRGGGHWRQWCRDLKRLLGQHGADARFTTMFDLYGLPDDFPELDVHADERDAAQRAILLEGAMTRTFNDYRLIPYIQLHEFEALVLAALDGLAELLDDDEDRGGLESLRTEIDGIPPEEVNTGKLMAPSKRLERSIPSYRKTVHGPLALEAVGLASLRGACPRFGNWVTTLENLGTTP